MVYTLPDVSICYHFSLLSLLLQPPGGAASPEDHWRMPLASLLFPPAGFSPLSHPFPCGHSLGRSSSPYSPCSPAFPPALCLSWDLSRLFGVTG